jgi:AcrR family transcriptional regulator
LEAAFRVFGRRGLHQATLDQVARAAGITKGTIYLYFPSKAALFTAMLTGRANEIVPGLESLQDGRGAPRTSTRLAAMARRLYRFFCSPAFLAMYRAVISAAPQFPDTASLVYREGILPANRRLAAVIQRGIDSGEFRGLDPLIAARAFVGMVQIFAVSQRLLGGQRILPLSDAKVIRTVTEILFRGLLAPRRISPRGRAIRGSR